MLHTVKILISFAIVAAPLFGDGGTVQFRAATTHFIVTLFSSPVPLRVGASDISVLIQDKQSNQAVLDNAVHLHFHLAGEQDIASVATRAQSTNKTLYASPIHFIAPGRWNVHVDVSHEKRWEETSGMLEILPEAPPWLSFWPYFAVVPTIIALFVTNQWLRSRQRKRTFRSPSS